MKMPRFITINHIFTKSFIAQKLYFKQDGYYAVVEVQTTWLSQPPPISIYSTAYVSQELVLCANSHSNRSTFIFGIGISHKIT